MADVIKPTKSGGYPLKRILRKASRSKTSLASPDANVEAQRETELALERTTSIALTLPDERLELSPPQSPLAEQEPQSPISTKEGKRRASLVGKIKRLTGEKKDKKPTMVEEIVEQMDNADLDQSPSTSDAPLSSGILPADVAKRVRDLLISAPPFYPTTLLTSEVPSGSPTNVTNDLIGAKFLATLSNQSLMAGSENQESVWSILERTKFNFKDNIMAESTTTDKNTNPDNSIMLCAPLIPDENSKVELAKYKLVKVPLDDLDGQSANANAWWPPSEWGKKNTPTKVVRVWIPSTTKISVQFSWWGFRMWVHLPLQSDLLNSPLLFIDGFPSQSSKF